VHNEAVNELVYGKRISEENFDPKIRRFLHPDMKFFQEHYVKGKLRNLQRAFYKDPGNTELAFRYVRELNRLQRFHIVRNLNNDIFSKCFNWCILSGQNANTYRRDLHFYRKLLFQIEFAYDKIQAQIDLKSQPLYRYDIFNLVHL
jgi:hypothetical protein